MKAMILAAGRGERMRPLTDTIPKPLLQAGSKCLIEYRLAALQSAGIRECVINLSYRAGQIREYLGNGERWALNIRYSHEGLEPLETAGGIIQALPLLGDEPFLLINADIWTDFDFGRLPVSLTSLAHLIMVDNPAHHSDGDFSLQQGVVCESGPNRLTYSGIGIYHPEMFNGYAKGKRPLKPLLLDGMRHKQITGEHYRGRWIDIGTPERLAELDRYLRRQDTFS